MSQNTCREQWNTRGMLQWGTTASPVSSVCIVSMTCVTSGLQRACRLRLRHSSRWQCNSWRESRPERSDDRWPGMQRSHKWDRLIHCSPTNSASYPLWDRTQPQRWSMTAAVQCNHKRGRLMLEATFSKLLTYQLGLLPSLGQETSGSLPRVSLAMGWRSNVVDGSSGVSAGCTTGPLTCTMDWLHNASLEH